MVALHTTPADLAAAAESLLWWAPQQAGEQLGVDDTSRDRERPFSAPNDDRRRGGFVATELRDEHGLAYLGWVYEGWLFVGDDGNDIIQGKRGASNRLKSQLGPRCLRAHVSLLMPPWIRVTVEFRGDRPRPTAGPYRVAGARGGDATPHRTMMPLLTDEESIPNDCLVFIYTKEPPLLGKRVVLESNITRIGRGADNHIVLDGNSVSRRHAHVERREKSYFLVDLGSTNGTYCNDEQISREVMLKDSDRVKIGSTIFKLLSGAGIEAQYHEEIFRMTFTDGLTQIYNKRYFHEALDREIIRRHEQEISILTLDIDCLKRTNDVYGDMAGDFVLKELPRIVQPRLRRNDVFARYDGERFSIVLPETSLADAMALAATLRQQVSDHVFTFQSATMAITVCTGAASLQESDRGATDLVKRAKEQLAEEKARSRGSATPPIPPDT